MMKGIDYLLVWNNWGKNWNYCSFNWHDFINSKAQAKVESKVIAFSSNSFASVFFFKAMKEAAKEQIPVTLFASNSRALLSASTASRNSRFFIRNINCLQIGPIFSKSLLFFSRNRHHLEYRLMPCSIVPKHPVCLLEGISQLPYACRFHPIVFLIHHHFFLIVFQDQWRPSSLSMLHQIWICYLTVIWSFTNLWIERNASPLINKHFRWRSTSFGRNRRAAS